MLEIRRAEDRGVQIWIVPEAEGLEPGYEQRSFGEEGKRGKLRLVGSRDGRDGSVTVHQDADLYAGCPDAGDEVTHRPGAGRKGWVQVARGRVHVNGAALRAGDGAALADEAVVAVRGLEDSEVLLFDMAPWPPRPPAGAG